jgi:hypothetical protein
MPLRPDPGNGIVDDLTGLIVPIDLSAALAAREQSKEAPVAQTPDLTVTMSLTLPELELYEPFPDRPAGSRRVVVMYARTAEGTRHRVGTLDVEADLWPAVEALAQEASVGWVTREELGIPGPFEQPK